MTTTKKQLFTAVAMLMVAMVALGTATYAWFVNNATVNVDRMNFKASASTALEIALAKPGDPTTAGAFKGTIAPADLNEYFKGFASGVFGDSYMNDVILIPASMGNTEYSFFREASGGWDLGAQTVTTFAGITAGEIGITTTAGIFKVPMYLRASEDMGVYLTTASSITVSPAATTNNAIYAMRMAIVPDGGENGKKVTYRAKAMGDHFDPAISKSTTTLSTSGTDIGDAIASVTNEGIPTLAQPAAPLFDDSVLVNPNGVPVLPPGFTVGGAKLFMNLKANVPQKFDVYIWLEGCDWDCVTAIARGDFDINLQFIGKQITTTP